MVERNGTACRDKTATVRCDVVVLWFVVVQGRGAMLVLFGLWSEAMLFEVVKVGGNKELRDPAS